MGVFFDRFEVTPDNGRPPARVRLSAALRTHAGDERVILAVRLDDDNDIWFNNVEGNPGRRKEIEFHGRVSSGGTQLNVTADLFYGPNDRTRSAFFRAAVLPPGGRRPMHRADDEIFIR
jgi:hypothetical protein